MPFGIVACTFSDNLSRNSCMHAIEVWGCTLFARCFKLDYYLRQYSILVIRRNRDMKLWRRITSTNTALSDFLPPQRTGQMRTRSHNYNLVPRAFPLKREKPWGRGWHNYILPNVRTGRFKSVFINRCLLNSN